MTDKSVWDKEVPVPARTIEYVDKGVIEKLPSGTKILGISPSGASYWARTAKIDATDEEGEPTPFFIKVHQFEHGKNMVSAEFYAMTLLHNAAPELVAEPLGWGQYAEEPDTYFFICRFHELSDGIPSVNEFPKLVAEFHKRGKSKTGEFGFPITMYGGRNPQTFPLSSTWEECFSQGLEKIFDMEEETHGPDEELRQLREGLMTKVIPRLLRPLETEGRTLVPTLVHGDLWDGNASVDVTTGHPMFFDATPLYAHHEYEMGPWWPLRHKMTHAYIAEYRKYYDASAPAEDFESRGALYALSDIALLQTSTVSTLLS
ncbi:Fructosamine kinase-domain-containing protein [Chaetomium sp. MPI-SDFR-AT-0129]|nr:Fructosamine kinase-domain-containing protein [Chaetomium sp. MPI-SDFR-AT-0129]